MHILLWQKTSNLDFSGMNDKYNKRTYGYGEDDERTVMIILIVYEGEFEFRSQTD